MDLVTWATQPVGRVDPHPHLVEPVLGLARRRRCCSCSRTAATCCSRGTRSGDRAEVDRLEAERKGLPARIPRHTFVARMFHWVMAVSMLVLVFTAFLPIVGVRFAWVEWHWMGRACCSPASILFHIVHATFFLDFWSIWVGPKDIPEFKAEMLREIGKEPGGPRPGKYPLGNRLYHLVVMIAGLAVIATGIADDVSRAQAASSRAIRT